MPPVRRRGGATPVSLLIDTNILLDVILDRAPWSDEAATLLDRIASGNARGFVAAHSITTIHYLIGRAGDRTRAVVAIGDLLEILDVVPLENDDFQRALTLQLADFEDAVQVAACLRAGADMLVSRNPRDFKGAPVAVRSAGEAVALIDQARR
jgi:predicted nucleic acid-binding protein